MEHVTLLFKKEECLSVAVLLVTLINTTPLKKGKNKRTAASVILPNADDGFLLQDTILYM